MKFLQLLKTLLLITALLITSILFFSAKLLAQPCIPNSGCIGGNVFEDYNCNGVDDTEPGMQGVEVQVYNESNTLIGTVYSDSAGDWQVCSLTDGSDYRVEFILPAALEVWAKPTHANTGGNQSNIQFLTAPYCTQFSVSNPSDFCQDNPLLAIPCYVNGDPTAGGTSGLMDWMVLFRNDNSGEIGSGGYIAPEVKTNGTVIGAKWGVAYHRKTSNILASALMKRHSGFGQNGTGAIYKISQTGVPSLFVDFNNYSNVNTGADTRGIANNTLPASATVATRDINAFQAVGKVGFGDIDISDDGQYLYAINLNERTLIEAYVGNDLIAPSTVTTYDIAAAIDGLVGGTGIACGTINDYRPWALKYYRGLIYMGVVCSAETSQVASEIHSYVMSFDPKNPGGGYTLVVDMPMNYAREAAFQSDNPSQTLAGTWRPWGTSWANTISTPWRGVALPSPILSDIEFDGSGALILGLMDRFGMQAGYRQLPTDLSNNNADWQGMQAGDVIRFCNISGTLTQEGNAGCAYNTSPPWPSPPVGFVPQGEFYAEEELYTTITTPNHGHPETSLGSLAYLAGTEEIVAGVYDPFALRSGGVAWWSNIDGSVNKEYELYESINQSGPDGSFGKAAALGDLEFMCDPAPLEIGNYIWHDSMQNGIQDASESGVNNMIVSLYDRNGVLVGQDTTSNSGQYYFNQYNVDTTGVTVNGTGSATPSTSWSGLSYDTQYFIIFGNGQFVNSNFTIGSDLFGITSMNNMGSNDNIDSDVDGSNLTAGGLGSRPDGLPYIDIYTSTLGGGDHKYDLGVVICTTPNCFEIQITRN